MRSKATVVLRLFAAAIVLLIVQVGIGGPFDSSLLASTVCTESNDLVFDGMRDRDVLLFSSKSSGIEYKWHKPTATVSTWSGVFQVMGKERSSFKFGEKSTIRWDGNGRFLNAEFGTSGKKHQLIVQYLVEEKVVEIVVTLSSCASSGLAIDVQSTTESIQEISLDFANASARSIIVPYNPFPVFYDESLRLFYSYFVDWSYGNATRLGTPKTVGPILSEANSFYDRKTDHTRNSVKQKFAILISSKLAGVFPKPSVARSSEAETLIGRPVLDLWTFQKFDDVNKRLKWLRNEGFRHCVVIIHIWQNGGPDNRLPTHFPAWNDYGGDDGLLEMISTIRSMDCLPILHQNFLDYYPNYELFDGSDLALSSEGSFLESFLKRSPRIQTFAMKPHVLREVSRKISAEIRERYKTIGIFHDVSGYFPPWRWTDMNAAEAEAGKYLPYFSNHRSALTAMRKVTGGPVLSEGQNHFFWLGVVDGVEAQLSVGYRGPGRDSPLLVDFDLRVLHPTQVSHGMGYYDRWAHKPFRFDFMANADDVDLYRMQEIAFGHQPYFGVFRNDSLTDLKQIYQLQKEWYLVGPIALRYGAREIANISYWHEGAWVETEKAIAEGSPLVVKVSYVNGLTVYANASSEEIEVDKVRLLRGGWYAEGAGVRGYSGVIREHRVDYLESPEVLYFDGRSNESDFGKVITSCSGYVRKSEVGQDVVLNDSCRDKKVWFRTDFLGDPNDQKCSSIFQGVETVTKNHKQYWGGTVSESGTCTLSAKR